MITTDTATPRRTRRVYFIGGPFDGAEIRLNCPPSARPQVMTFTQTFEKKETDHAYRNTGKTHRRTGAQVFEFYKSLT